MAQKDKVYTSLSSALNDKEQVYQLNVYFNAEDSALIDSLRCFKNLTYLQLVITTQTFPMVILELKQLKKLHLEGNNLKSLPLEISALTELEELNLSRNNLTTLPPSLADLVHLKYLDLEYNKLDTVPFCIGNIQQLKVLILNRNSITTFHENIKNLTQLTRLDLNFNKLTSLPNTFSKLQNLNSLELKGGEFSTYPEVISDLSQLTKLDISQVSFNTLPASISKLKQLKELWLEYNKMTVFPEAIIALPNLEILKMKRNNLTQLPASISKMQSIKTIDLMLNDLTELPESIGDLKTLENLDCSFGYIKNIPESLGKLSHLKLLNAQYNELERRPAFLTKLPKTTTVNLLGNSFEQERLEKKAYYKNNEQSFTDERDGSVYQTIQINTQTWMAENLHYVKMDTSQGLDTTLDGGRLYRLNQLQDACPDGWHNATVEDWRLLFKEAMAEFQEDPDASINERMKEERKVVGDYREDQHVWFDPTEKPINLYPVKRYFAESGSSQSSYSKWDNFYNLNIKLNQSYGGRSKHTVFLAYNKEQKLMGYLFFNYERSVKEMEIKGEVFYPVRCVKN